MNGRWCPEGCCIHAHTVLTVDPSALKVLTARGLATSGWSHLRGGIIDKIPFYWVPKRAQQHVCRVQWSFEGRRVEKCQGHCPRHHGFAFRKQTDLTQQWQTEYYVTKNKKDMTKGMRHDEGEKRVALTVAGN